MFLTEETQTSLNGGQKLTSLSALSLDIFRPLQNRDLTAKNQMNYLKTSDD